MGLRGFLPSEALFSWLLLIPPIRDGLVLGKRSPIGCVAIRKALELLGNTNFTPIELEDEVVSFVLERIKPLMAPEEILHLDLEVEVLVEGAFQ